MKRGLTAENIKYRIQYKKRAISFWQSKKNVADFYIKQNEKEIEQLQEKMKKLLKTVQNADRTHTEELSK